MVCKYIYIHMYICFIYWYIRTIFFVRIRSINFSNIYTLYTQSNFFKIYSSAVNNFITASQHFTRNPLHIYSSCQSQMNIHIWILQSTSLTSCSTYHRTWAARGVLGEFKPYIIGNVFICFSCLYTLHILRLIDNPLRKSLQHNCLSARVNLII